MSDLFREQRQRDAARSASRPAAFESIKRTQAIFDKYTAARASEVAPRGQKILWGRVALVALLILALVGAVLALLHRG